MAIFSSLRKSNILVIGQFQRGLSTGSMKPSFSTFHSKISFSSTPWKFHFLPAQSLSIAKDGYTTTFKSPSLSEESPMNPPKFIRTNNPQSSNSLNFHFSSPSQHVATHLQQTPFVMSSALPLFNVSKQFSPLFPSSRSIATQPVNVHLPPPPPKEYDANGQPKKYRLTQKVYDHKYNWERWALMPAGVFHTVYYGEFGRDYSPFIAYLLNFPLWIALIPFTLFSYFVSYCISNMGCIGVRPKRYSVEWMEASIERDRAENTNPMTRYLDRRRKERGTNWMLEDYMPTHPHFLFMDSYIHDKSLQKQSTGEEDED